MSALSSRWFHSRTNTGTLTLPFRPPSCSCSFRATHSAFFRISISSVLRSLAGTMSHKQGQGGQPLLLPHGDPSAQFRRKKEMKKDSPLPPPHALTLPRNTPALPPRPLPGAWRDSSFPRGLLLEPIHLPCAGCFHPWTVQENHEELIRSHQFKPNVALYPSHNIPASLPVGYDVTHINGRAKPARSPEFRKQSDRP